VICNVDFWVIFQSPKKDPAEEEAYAKAFTMVSIPPSLIVRQLASAIE
jgi:Rab3 GTPase-activating protein catalytic subunit